MKNKFPKIIYFLLCFLLIFEQSGFAQVAGQLDISGYFNGIGNALVQDKFRPLHLRYLSYDNLNDSFKLLLDKGDSGDLKEANLKDSTKELLNYFFTGITLPNDSFWVNLRPDSAENIIDDYLGQTEAGRILLEADVQLKKDTAAYTSPQTPEGRVYWDKLYKKAEELLGSSNVTIPTLVRPWIVPGEIIIREAKDNAYIYKATLKVLLEDDYLKNSTTYNFQDPRLKALNEYSSQLIKEKIIPKLIKEVNTSKKYAPLRQVYYSLILAQWFKARFYGKKGPYSSRIDKRDLTGLTSTGNWSKQQYFQQYQNSFKDGEYNIKEKIHSAYGQVVRTYTSGGISIADIGMSSSPVAPGKVFTSGPLTVIGSNKVVSRFFGIPLIAMTMTAGSLLFTGQAAAQNKDNRIQQPSQSMGESYSPKGILEQNFVQKGVISEKAFEELSQAYNYTMAVIDNDVEWDKILKQYGKRNEVDGFWGALNPADIDTLLAKKGNINIVEIKAHEFMHKIAFNYFQGDPEGLMQFYADLEASINRDNYPQAYGALAQLKQIFINDYNGKMPVMFAVHEIIAYYFGMFQIGDFDLSREEFVEMLNNQRVDSKTKESSGRKIQELIYDLQSVSEVKVLFRNLFKDLGLTHDAQFEKEMKFSKKEIEPKSSEDMKAIAGLFGVGAEENVSRVIVEGRPIKLQGIFTPSPAQVEMIMGMVPKDLRSGIEEIVISYISGEVAQKPWLDYKLEEGGVRLKVDPGFLIRQTNANVIRHVFSSSPVSVELGSNRKPINATVSSPVISYREFLNTPEVVLSLAVNSRGEAVGELQRLADQITKDFSEENFTASLGLIIGTKEANTYRINRLQPITEFEDGSTYDYLVPSRAQVIKIIESQLRDGEQILGDYHNHSFERLRSNQRPGPSSTDANGGNYLNIPGYENSIAEDRLGLVLEPELDLDNITIDELANFNPAKSKVIVYPYITPNKGLSRQVKQLDNIYLDSFIDKLVITIDSETINALRLIVAQGPTAFNNPLQRKFLLDLARTINFHLDHVELISENNKDELYIWAQQIYEVLKFNPSLLVSQKDLYANLRSLAHDLTHIIYAFQLGDIILGDLPTEADKNQWSQLERELNTFRVILNWGNFSNLDTRTIEGIFDDVIDYVKRSNIAALRISALAQKNSGNLETEMAEVLVSAVEKLEIETQNNIRLLGLLRKEAASPGGKSPVNIDTSMQDIAGEFIGKKLGEIEVKLNLNARGAYVNANLLRLMDTCKNLINNGIDAISTRIRQDKTAGLLTITTALSSDNGKDFVEITFADNGTGIPAELLKDRKIFGDGFTTKGSGGTGTGLYLVNEHVKFNGGTVEAYSDGPGKGTRFVIRLPVIQPNGAVTTEQPAASSPVLGKWAQRMVLGMFISAMPVLAIMDNPDPLMRSINQGKVGSLERALMLSVDDSLLAGKIFPNIDYEGLAAKSAQGDGEAFLQLLTLYRHVGEYGAWGKYVSDTLPGYLKNKINAIDVNVFKDKAINGDCFAIEAIYVLAKEHRNYDVASILAGVNESILAGVKLDKLLEKINQGDPHAYVVFGLLMDYFYMYETNKYFSKIEPSALINRYLSGEKNTYFDRAISLYADQYKSGNAKKLVGLLLGEANKGNIEALNVLVNVVGANLEREDQLDILGKKINPYGLNGKINAENIDLVVYIFKTLIENNNTTALSYLYDLAAGYKEAKDLLAGFCNNRVLQLRYAHLDERISSVELEKRLIQENMGDNPRFLYLAFSSEEMFGDLAKMVFDKLQNMARQKGFSDVDSYLKSLDPGNVFYTNFVLQSANFSLLGDMIESPESLGRITKLLFQDLSADYMKNLSARFALFVEKTVENKDFKYQKYFQESLLSLYRLAKDDFHRRFLAAILSLYKEDMVYLNGNSIKAIEKNENVFYKEDDYKIDYRNLLKNGKLIVNLVYADEDAMKSSFGSSLSFFSSKGYVEVAKTANRTTLENASRTVRIVLIDNSRDDSNYDIDKEASEGARIFSARNHAGNSGKVYKLLGNKGTVASGLREKYADSYFILGQCRGATVMSELKNSYGLAGVIAINGTGFGYLTDPVIWKFAENLASRKYRNVYEASQATIEELPKTVIEDYVFPSNKAGIFGEIINKIIPPRSSSPVTAMDDFLVELEVDAIASSINEAITREKAGQSANLLGIYMSGVTVSLTKYQNSGLDFNTVLNRSSTAMSAKGIDKTRINQLSQGIRQWQDMIEKLAVVQKNNQENIGAANAKLSQRVEELTAGGKEIVIHGTSIDNFLGMLASGQMTQGEINNFGKGNYFEIAKSGDSYAVSPDRTELLLLFDKDSFIKDHGLVSERDFIVRKYIKDGVVTGYEFFVIRMDLSMQGDYLKYFKLITPDGVSDIKATASVSSPIEIGGLKFYSNTALPAGAVGLNLSLQPGAGYPDLLIYGFPTSDGHIALNGGIINSTNYLLADKNLLRPLLNKFFELYPQADRTSESLMIPILIKILIQDFGFQPKDGVKPNAWMGEPVNGKSGLYLTEEAWGFAFGKGDLKGLLPATSASMHTPISVPDDFNGRDAQGKELFRLYLGEGHTIYRIPEVSASSPVEPGPKKSIIEFFTDRQRKDLIEKLINVATKAETPFDANEIIKSGHGLLDIWQGSEAVTARFLKELDVISLLMQDSNPEIQNKLRPIIQDLKDYVEFSRKRGPFAEGEFPSSDSKGSSPVAQKTELPDKIKQKIILAGGKISYADFMGTALYDPDCGYYSRFVNIGKGKDFDTDSEHVEFGNAMAGQLLDMWSIMGEPSDFRIVEMGAGRGTLAKNILEYLSKEPRAKDLYKNLKYIIVDVSEHLKAIQTQSVLDFPGKVEWRDLAELKDIQGVFISNELVDAFPVHIIKKQDGQFREVFVSLKDGSFTEELGELSSQEMKDYARGLASVSEGEEVPFSPYLSVWSKQVAKALKRGFIITADYGVLDAKDYASHENIIWSAKGDTVRNARKQIYSQIASGRSIDITWLINFADLSNNGQGNGVNSISLFSLRDSDFSPAFRTTEVAKYLAVSPDFRMLMQEKGVFDSTTGSSPVTNDKGGIDFRAMPIVTSPAVNTRFSNMPAPVILGNINLDESFVQIQNMLKAGIIPSNERIKEYLQSCCGKQSMDREIDNILACIADILRLQEDQAVSTELSLKEMLALVESERPANEMQFVLAKITIEGKEPSVIAQ